MKNVVYLITFLNRKIKKEYPFRYIGSKSNAILKNKKIFSRNNKEYRSSSKHKEFLKAINSEKYNVKILYIGKNYHDILKKEKEYHLKFNVVKNEKFFNLAIAMENTFSNPEYGTYKHIDTGNVVRLKRNDEDVINGIYVGVSKGCKNNHKKPMNNYGKNNPFYGKKHSEETKKKISLGIKNSFTDIHKKKIGERSKKLFTGIPKTEEHKKKIGRKGFVMLHKKNHKSKRIKRTDKNFNLLLENGWSTKAINKEKKYKCDYCPIITTKGNLTRWHNENCKHKKN